MDEAGGIDDWNDWEDEWDYDDIDDEGDGSGDSSSAGYKEDEYGNYRGTEVPRGFPADILYKDSVMLEAMKDNMDILLTRYIVSICTEDPYEKVAEYYRGILSGMQGFEEEAVPGYCTFKTVTGDEKDYEVTVGERTSYTFHVLPENAKTAIRLIYTEYKELPKEYRADLVPVMEGSIPVQGSFYEYQNGKKEFRLLYDIKKDFEDVVAYCKEVMSGAGSYEEELGDFSGNFRGIKDNVEIFVSVGRRNDKCSYSISLSF